jgi:hypothetical protein
MMKFPFGRRSREGDPEPPSAAFAAYCDEERERMRDAGEPFDEGRFRAAVELALGRLKSIEREERA